MKSTRSLSSRWYSVSASSSRIVAGFLALGLAGCVGPWNDLPSDKPVQIRATVAVFVRQGASSMATFSRPIDMGAETGMHVAWIDPSNSAFRIEENSPACRDSLSYKTSGSIPTVYQSSNWSYTSSSNFSMASCGAGRTWRFRGHLRWNASSPFSVAEPLWVTDSVDTWGELSTTPNFLRGNLAGPLELRWSTLAQADSSTRTEWSRSPHELASLVNQWKWLQTARGREARVLALDTTSKPSAWRWFDLDTTLLRRAITSTYVLDVQTVFTAGDTIWLATDHNTWIQALATGIGAKDFYEAMVLNSQYGYSLASILPSEWSSRANWQSFVAANRWGEDTAQVWFRLPSKPMYSQRVELAVAGTCPGQRTFLHQGGSNRQQLPHGNAAPMDGFVCEVLTDTISFPLGQ